MGSTLISWVRFFVLLTFQISSHVEISSTSFWGHDDLHSSVNRCDVVTILWYVIFGTTYDRIQELSSQIELSYIVTIDERV